MAEAQDPSESISSIYTISKVDMKKLMLEREQRIEALERELLAAQKQIQGLEETVRRKDAMVDNLTRQLQQRMTPRLTSQCSATRADKNSKSNYGGSRPVSVRESPLDFRPQTQ